MNSTTVALIYDFDGTLSPGNMQEFGFIQAIGKGIDEFWEKCGRITRENDANSILVYMYQMLQSAKSNDISLRRDSFKQFGAQIALLDGVKEWFSLINTYGASIGLNVKHYIISSGLKEMIEGTTIAHEFENIYACSFLYNVDGVAYWPAVAIDYTAKTQFLFKINKGIKEVSDNTKINQYISASDRPVPFENMIYFGDGTTDIPCMKMVKSQGGHSIAVYGNEKKKATAYQLIKEDRVNFACPANYTEDCELMDVVKRILDKIQSDISFRELLLTNENKARM